MNSMKTTQSNPDELPQWKIPVTWKMCGFVYINAATLEEAMKVAEDKEGKLPLPTDGDYVDDSWVLSETNPEYVRECYNNNQKNKKTGENQDE